MLCSFPDTCIRSPPKHRLHALFPQKPMLRSPVLNKTKILKKYTRLAVAVRLKISRPKLLKKFTSKNSFRINLSSYADITINERSEIIWNPLCDLTSLFGWVRLQVTWPSAAYLAGLYGQIKVKTYGIYLWLSQQFCWCQYNYFLLYLNTSVLNT